MWTEIVLKAAEISPSDDRRGYVLESPMETYSTLTINGQLTEEELHNLVDSLVPAKEYKEE
ncbi:MAG: hypothetical protein ACYTF1_24110, partial [Planctomycetota bacterium]|jgi:hypothetical protein